MMCFVKSSPSKAKTSKLSTPTAQTLALPGSTFATFPQFFLRPGGAHASSAPPVYAYELCSNLRSLVTTPCLKKHPRHFSCNLNKHFPISIILAPKSKAGVHCENCHFSSKSWFCLFKIINEVHKHKLKSFHK